MEENHEEEISVEDLSSHSLVKQMQLVCPTAASGYVRIHPWAHSFPTGIEKHLNEISEFQCFDDDVWISSFPKCGTTWTQEMVWCIANDIDIQTAKKVPLKTRAPFFEHKIVQVFPLPQQTSVPGSFDVVKNTPRPRIIKTHLPYGMLPKQSEGKKLIYVTRNPRDACVSFFHHHKILNGYTGSFKDFAQLFMNGIVEYSPFSSHVKEYWKRRSLPNILFITFEQMKRDLPAVLEKVAMFLGKQLTTENIAVLCDHLSFKKMQENDAVNKKEVVDTHAEMHKKNTSNEESPVGGRFFRKGEVGNWKEYFDEELLGEFVQWERKELNEKDLKFEFEM